MTRQGFKTTNVLRLQIENEWPALPNLIQNTGGEFGTWGWWPNLDANLTVQAGPTLEIKRTTGLPATVMTDYLGVTPSSVVTGNKYVRGRVFMVTGSGGGTGISARFDFYGRDKAFISSGPTTAVLTTNATALDVPAALVPTNANLVRLVISLTASASGLSVWFNAATVVNGTSAEVATTPTAEPGWADLLSPATSLNIAREGLDLGVLSAVVRDSTLDPATAALIRKGKVVRVQALTTGTGQWDYLFRGTLLNADVTYDLLHPHPTRRARIALLAVDPASRLANTPRPDGVQTINELLYVLGGAGVPWKINGTVTSKITATAVARNDKASALDQVALTRDTNLGYAWLSRAGVLNAWDSATLPAVSLDTLDETDYSDLQLGFNTEDLINDVTVIVRSIDAVTGDTIETPYGPYSDEVSVRKWDRYHRDFTVQASGWTATNAQTYALAILAANATPSVRIKSMTLPITDTATDLAANGAAFRDLYDLVTVTNTAAALSHTARITRVEHKIEPEKWLVEVGFAPNGAVATPQQTAALPAPLPTADTAWIALPFAAFWGNFGSGHRQCQYRRRGGVVELRGLAIIASGGGFTMATLPVGFRPAEIELYAVMTTDGSNVRLDVNPNGTIVLTWPTITATDWISLAGITFAAEL